jgi:hypothetical protein
VVSEIDVMDAIGSSLKRMPNRYPAAKTRVFVDSLAERFGDEPVWDALSRKDLSKGLSDRRL